MPIVPGAVPSGCDERSTGVDTLWNKLNFVSLMMALFFGTAALPHILIRYDTVLSPACARKSTIVAIAAIAFAVAASANPPAILMLLFWKETTAAG